MVIAIIALAVYCCILLWRITEIEKQEDKAVSIANDATQRAYNSNNRVNELETRIDSMRREINDMGDQLETCRKLFDEVDARLEEKSEAEQKIVESERLFQEGLKNIMNYGIIE